MNPRLALLQNNFGRKARFPDRQELFPGLKLGNEFCEFCAEGFENNSNLKIHTRFTHTFDCEICGISFKTLTDLETHMHTCERFDC